MPFVRPSISNRQPARNSDPVAPSDPISRQLQLFETAVISIQKNLTDLAENLAAAGNPRPQQQAAQGFGKLRSVIARMGGKL